MQRGRHVLALLAAAVTVSGTAAGAALPTATGAAQNQWLGMRVLNQVHQGGEDESPSNTLYAYQDGLSKGGDMIELDVHATKDGQIVAIHDDTVDRTTNGHGPVEKLTLAQLRKLDAAYWFVPGENAVKGKPASAYPLRGVRTGRKRPPKGFEADDFRIPTLAEVFQAFPDVPVNVEIKGRTQAERLRVADLLATFLKRARKRDVIVVSFDQAAVDRFHKEAPGVDVAPGVEGISGYLLGGVAPPAGTKALQIPIKYDIGGVTLQVVTRERVEAAHRAGYAVHVWLDKSEENDATYGMLADDCVDGVMTADPTRYEAFLERRGLPRVGGQGGDSDKSLGCRQPAAPPPGCRVRASKLVTPRGGAVVVRLERFGDLRRRCRARIALSAWASGRRVVLGSAVGALPAGRVAAIATVRLTQAGHALLRRAPGPLPVTAAVTGTRTLTRTLPLAPPGATGQAAS